MTDTACELAETVETLCHNLFVGHLALVGIVVCGVFVVWQSSEDPPISNFFKRECLSNHATLAGIGFITSGFADWKQETHFDMEFYSHCRPSCGGPCKLASQSSKEPF